MLIEKQTSREATAGVGRRGKRRPLLVAIVGGSGSGKTWLAEKLERSFGRAAARLSQDDFYRDRSCVPPSRRSAINFDHPRAIDWTELERVLRDCRKGKKVAVPVYDFRTHCRASRFRMVNSQEILLVDGLWLLRRPTVCRLFDVKIFIDCPAPTRLRRRLARDLALRGRSRSSVLAQFRQTVEPMHRKFVAPQVRRADFVVKGNLNTAAVRQLARAIRDKLTALRSQ